MILLRTNELIEDLPMEKYLEDPGIGSSRHAKMLDTPADYKAELEVKFKSSPALELGTQIHSKCMENDTFNDFYIYESKKFDKRSKKGKEEFQEFVNEAEGKTVIPLKNKPIIDAAEKAFWKHYEIPHIMKGAKIEVTGISEVLGLDLRIKTREDIYTKNGWIYDIKTTSEKPTDANLSKVIHKYNYHFKAAHHIDVMERCGEEVQGFGWIFITTHLPHTHVIIKTMSPKLRNFSRNLYEETLIKLSDCTKENEWNGYTEIIEEIELPPWA